MNSKNIPLEDFFKNPIEASFSLSPSGNYLLYKAPYKNRLNLFVRPTKGGEIIQLTFETERSVAGAMWANEDRILYLKDCKGNEIYQLYGVDRDGNNVRSYTDFEGVRTQMIDDLEKDNEHILIGLNKNNPEVFDPYRLNIYTGELTQIATNPGNIDSWMTDHNGCLRCATAIVDGINTQLLYRESENEEFKVVLTTNFKDTVSFLTFTADNKEVYALTNLNSDKMVLMRMNPATGEELEKLYEHPRYDISSISYSEYKQKLLGVVCTGHKGSVRHFFDKEEETIRKQIERQVGHEYFGTVDYSKNEQIRIIFVGGDKTKGAYYLYNVITNELSLLANLAPWLKEEEMQAMLPVTYMTRDGLEIEAYLTLPNQLDFKEAKNLPLVVNPHGGPWARDCWGFDAEVQFLASRGYAVLQMNFRGSVGFGKKFVEASYKQWGQNMQNDITDGVNWLIKEGVVDPKRVAIYGGSYGGYATLAGLAFTPELYACGIDYVGVANLFTFMQTIPTYWKPMLEMMYEMVGDPVKDKEMMEKYSPVFHADKIKVPLLIAQGANDPRVNKAESDQMVEALTKRGVEVTYIVKDDEGHGFVNEENRFEFYRAMEDFLCKYLG